MRYLAKRSCREELQVLAASATLDQSTRRKLDTLLRPSPRIGAPAVCTLILTRPRPCPNPDPDLTLTLTLTTDPNPDH